MASWCDILPIHPAAELFPRMTPDELRELGEDIKKQGGLPAVPLALWEAEKGRLQQEKRQLEIKITGLESEIEELRAMLPSNDAGPVPASLRRSP